MGFCVFKQTGPPHKHTQTDPDTDCLFFNQHCWIYFLLTENTMIEHNNEDLLAPSIELRSDVFVLGYVSAFLISLNIPTLNKCISEQTRTETSSMHTAACVMLNMTCAHNNTRNLKQNIKAIISAHHRYRPIKALKTNISIVPKRTSLLI